MRYVYLFFIEEQFPSAFPLSAAKVVNLTIHPNFHIVLQSIYPPIAVYLSFPFFAKNLPVAKGYFLAENTFEEYGFD